MAQNKSIAHTIALFLVKATMTKIYLILSYLIIIEALIKVYNQLLVDRMPH